MKKMIFVIFATMMVANVFGQENGDMDLEKTLATYFKIENEIDSIARHDAYLWRKHHELIENAIENGVEYDSIIKIQNEIRTEKQLSNNEFNKRQELYSELAKIKTKINEYCEKILVEEIFLKANRLIYPYSEMENFLKILKFEKTYEESHESVYFDYDGISRKKYTDWCYKGHIKNIEVSVSNKTINLRKYFSFIFMVNHRIIFSKKNVEERKIIEYIKKYEKQQPVNERKKYEKQQPVNERKNVDDMYIF